MNYSAYSLPSLVHPLIVSPAEGVESVRKKPRFLPPFPAIDINNWAGFHIPRLRWVGVKAPREGGLDLTSYPTKLALNHEFCHRRLGATSFSQSRDHEGLVLHLLIKDAFDEGQEKIPVPIRSDSSRNKLEKQWRRIVGFAPASNLIEEVYAVRSSLLETRAENLIGDYVYRKLRGSYLVKYEEFIPGYKAVFESFDFVADKIGETAATAIILSVLETINPVLAFVEILCHMCHTCHTTPVISRQGLPTGASLIKASWIASHEETELMKNLSRQEALLYFGKFLDELDQDDSIMIAKRGWILSQYIDHDNIAKLILGSPTTILISAFSENVSMHRIYKSDVTEEGEVFEEVEERSPTNFAILLESILQQLAQGMGLVCPFWFWIKPSQTCCGERNRAFLEKVWKYTKPDNSCPIWMRLGCLNKSSRIHCNARG